MGPEIASTLIRDIRAQGEFVTSVFNHRAALAANVGEPIQCRAGCSACCSDYAMVAPTDMLLLVDAYQKMSPDDQAYVREKNARWMEAHAGMDAFPLVYDNPGQIQEFDALVAEYGLNGQRTMTGMTTSLNHREKTPCSFLKAGKCMVYDSRPLSCRGHNVIDKRGPQVCEDVLHADDELSVKQFGMSDACLHVFQRYVECGLPQFPNGELNAVLARWLSQQDQESK